MCIAFSKRQQPQLQQHHQLQLQQLQQQQQQHFPVPVDGQNSMEAVTNSSHHQNTGLVQMQNV